MNQREATVTLIEFVRQHAPEDKRVLKALKMMEKRSEALRVRYERRYASVSDDIFEEPLTVTYNQFRGLFLETVCVACWNFKESHVAFCPRCFARLDAPTAKAFFSKRTIHYGFCRALRFFGRRPESRDGMLYWRSSDEKGGSPC